MKKGDDYSVFKHISFMSLTAFMLEDGIQTFFQFTLYEGFSCSCLCGYYCEISYNRFSSLSGIATATFSSIITLLGSLVKLYEVFSKGFGTFKTSCKGFASCNGTKKGIILIMMFIGTFSNGIMNISRIVNVYFISIEDEQSLFSMYLLIVSCIWVTCVCYSVALVVYFSFHSIKDKIYRSLHVVGVLINSNFIAFAIFRASDKHMIIDTNFAINYVIIPIGAGLFCHLLALIYKCIRKPK